MSIEDRHLLLGALLHDVGKLTQRTEDVALKDAVQSTYPWHKPQNRYGATHEKWGAYFVRTMDLAEEIEMMVLRHHSPETNAEKILHIADCLSCGERAQAEKKQESAASEPLVNLLSRIAWDDPERKEPMNLPEPTYFPLTPYSLDTQAFPTSDRTKALKNTDYKTLSTAYRKELKDILSGKPLPSVERILYLNQKYQVHVPSAAYYHRPDISLYDHHKTTAAISLCLARSLESGATPPKVLDTPIPTLMSTRYQGAQPFLLVGGDISGLQDFIYSISCENAASSLKGRSVYLELLTRTIAHYILDELRLSRTNILYIGGGCFYLLMPACEKERLGSLKDAINRKLLSVHKGSLAVIIAQQTLGFSDFDRKQFGAVWDDLHTALGRHKQQKFKMQLHADYETIFKPPYGSGRYDQCTACGRESKTLIEEKCPWCISFENLGRQVRNAEGLHVDRTKQAPDTINNWEHALALFGYSYSFTPPETTPTASYKLNDPDYNPHRWTGFTFLANAMATKEDAIKTFEDLAEASEGIKQWAVLRADVDNLGAVFQKGLKDDQSISRYTTLSRLISTFFGGRVNRLVEDVFSETIHLLYSGGDDLFVVGSWSELPRFYETLTEEFNRFTGENPHMTLSGAQYIAPRIKYPLYSAAEEAGKALESRAKKHTRPDGRRKDALLFLDEVVENERLAELKVLKRELSNLITKGVSKGFLHTIHSTAKDRVSLGEENLIRIWRLVYSMTRLAKRHPDCSEEILKLENKLTKGTTHLQAHATLAARWTELATRKE